MRRRTLLAALPASLGLTAPPRSAAAAAGDIRLAVCRKGAWDTCVAELGVRAGMFARYGIAVGIEYTRDNDETLQAVQSRRVDMGMGVDTLAVMAAFAAGAPVRIAANGTTGSAEIFWYVKSDSPIRSIRDCTGRSIACAAPGAPTQSLARELAATFRIEPLLVPTGDAAATLARVMARQVDVGWSAAPANLDAAALGVIRVIAYGNNVPVARAQTVRVDVSHAAVLEQRREALDWFMQCYRETLDWMYSNPEAVPALARLTGVAAPMVGRLRTDFFPRAALWPDRVGDLDTVMDDAVRLGILAAPLTDAQLARLVRVPGYARPRLAGPHA